MSAGNEERNTATDVLIGGREYFDGIGKIRYEGPRSDNPLAFKWYDENRVIGRKSMRDHLRFAVAYWHTFCGAGTDPFGLPTKDFPWAGGGDALKRARNKMDAAFELFTKLGVPYYCFHDTDMVEEGESLADNERLLQASVE